MALPTDHPTVRFGKIGVLLINLGTPDATDFRSMRRYLAEFLNDRRVIDLPRALWWPILYGIILNTRPKKSGAAYDKIWLKDTDESPLRAITRSQADQLQQRLGDSRIVVDWAMRYGNPSIKSRVQALQDQGCDRIYAVALYPQYAGATTASVHDKLFDALKDLKWMPTLRTAAPWHDNPVYIDALRQSIVQHLETLDWDPEILLASFHGIPKRYMMAGDPYHCQCQKTGRLLAESLGWPAERLRVTFQSRFGKEEWLQPYTDKTLEALPGQGTKRVAVIMPGFVADCVETLEEIAIEGGKSFAQAGGTHFTTVPCLNAGEGGMRVLEALAMRDLAGWIEPDDIAISLPSAAE